VTAAFTDADELVRRRGDRWTLVARHPLLKLFFRPGGDYEFVARHPEALSTSTGGNEVDWELDGDEVVLSHQLIRGPGCRVDRAALVAAIRRLATTRRVARPRAAKKTATKKAHAIPVSRSTPVVVAAPRKPKTAPRRVATQ